MWNIVHNSFCYLPVHYYFCFLLRVSIKVYGETNILFYSQTFYTFV